MWKVSWFYEKVRNIANFGGYAAILNANTLQGNVYVAETGRENHNVAVLLDYMVNSLYVVELATEWLVTSVVSVNCN